MTEIKHRWIEKKIKKYISDKKSNLLYINGLYMCGKKTLVKSFCNKNIEHVFYDDLLEEAMNEHKTTVLNKKKLYTNNTFINRKIAKSLLLQNIKNVKNEEKTYIITNSFNPLVFKKIIQDEKNNITNILMRPISYGESLGLKPVFFKRLRNLDFIDNTGYDLKKIIKLAIKGGLTENPYLSKKRDKIWYEKFLLHILNHELLFLKNEIEVNKIKETLLILCKNSSDIFTPIDIRRKIDYNIFFAKANIRKLQSCFLIDFLPHWNTPDDRASHCKTTCFINDSGLMYALLDLTPKKVLNNPQIAINMVRTFIYSQIKPQIDIENNTNLFHWRQKYGYNIDFIIETKNKMYGIKIACEDKINQRWFLDFSYFKRYKYKRKNFVGIIIYLGKTVQYVNDIYFIPINNIWE